MKTIKKIGTESKYKDTFEKYAEVHDIPIEWLYAIARQESALRPSTVVKTGGDGKRGGAYGVFQMTLKTARTLGFAGNPDELLDVDTNTKYATKLIAYWMARHPGNLSDVYARYNSGQTYIRAPQEATREAAQRVVAYADFYSTHEV